MYSVGKEFTRDKCSLLLNHRTGGEDVEARRPGDPTEKGLHDRFMLERSPLEASQSGSV